MWGPALPDCRRAAEGQGRRRKLTSFQSFVNHKDEFPTIILHNFLNATIREGYQEGKRQVEESFFWKRLIPSCPRMPVP